MNPENFAENFGALRFPLVPASFTDATGLTPLDPVRKTIVEVVRAAANAEFGTVWTNLTAGLGVKHPLKNSQPVTDVLELVPDKHILERQTKWPLLILYRDGEAPVEEHTMFVDRLVQSWALHYVLGPVSLGEIRKYGDICTAVAKVVAMIIRDHGHRSYNSGATIFGPRSGLARLVLKSVSGPAQARFVEGGDAPTYYAISMTLESVETSGDDTTGFDSYEATDFEVEFGGDEAGAPVILLAQTDEDPDAPLGP